MHVMCQQDNKSVTSNTDSTPGKESRPQDDQITIKMSHGDIVLHALGREDEVIFYGTRKKLR
jgi:hypothetical protein